MHFSRISEELAIQPGDTAGLTRLIAAYPYFETPYILKVVAEKNLPGNEKTLHNAALVCNNPAWLQALLMDVKVAQTVPEPVMESVLMPETVFIPGESVSETVEDDVEEQSPQLAIETPITPETPVPDTTAPEIPVPAEETVFHTATEEITTPPHTDFTEISPGVENEPVPETTAEETPVEAVPVNILTEETKPEVPGVVSEHINLAENQPVTPVSEPEIPAFEPFHTVDYFASQGIKISKEAIPTDRFSHQLRSFTEWLKAMKRLPTGEMDTPIKPAQQDAVTQLAETSLKKTEVITETMAEVLVKQGRVGEAIEILQKLSLQDKAKSAYFAARIQHLKTI